MNFIFHDFIHSFIHFSSSSSFCFKSFEFRIICVCSMYNNNNKGVKKKQQQQQDCNQIKSNRNSKLSSSSSSSSLS
ncbi:hypothetical protein DERF_015004 [Dermatophagoides farinae]|uniref:Uncharacterized protein n=1 Tax=Dermatophagoides farinae TaxID=6954 RepID=A0A922KU67_DERFA|nr:hypothetical protein DERF_015004 [Dermatophagoides farinae]